MLPYLCALYAPLVYTQPKKRTTEMMTNYGAGYGQHVHMNLLGALLGRSDHLKVFREPISEIEINTKIYNHCDDAR